MENKDIQTREIAAATLSEMFYQLAEAIMAIDGTVTVARHGGAYGFAVDGAVISIIPAQEGGVR